MMASERGARPATLDSYGRDLSDFEDFLKENMVRATPDHIKAYLKDLSARGMAPSTISRRLSSLRQFYKFLMSEGGI